MHGCKHCCRGATHTIMLALFASLSNRACIESGAQHVQLERRDHAIIDHAMRVLGEDTGSADGSLRIQVFSLSAYTIPACLSKGQHDIPTFALLPVQSPHNMRSLYLYTDYSIHSSTSTSRGRLLYQYTVTNMCFQSIYTIGSNLGSTCIGFTIYTREKDDH
jgi:hypothetical protein